MNNEELKEMWNNFETKVTEYENKLREKFQKHEKYSNLTLREIDEKIRKSVNRKFKDENMLVLSTHVHGVLSGTNGLWASIKASR